MNIKFVKLITGEEIIADTELDANETHFTLKKGVRIFPTEEGLSFVPFPMFAKTTDGGIVVKKEHIVYVVDPEDELRNAYNVKFGTGIVLANNLDIVG